VRSARTVLLCIKVDKNVEGQAWLNKFGHLSHRLDGRLALIWRGFRD